MTHFRYDYIVDMYRSTVTILVLDEFVSTEQFHDAMTSLDIPVLEEDEEGDKDLFPCRALCFKRPFEPGDEPYEGASQARVVIVITRDTPLELLAHEATHAALFLSDWHGLPVSVKASLQEPLAYLVGFITDCVHDAQADARRAAAGRRRK